ncbi:MAG: SRPBCC family protein [Cytophagales bacterium]|nr:SRPBCC family protein [Cytophagales bacterium]
MAILKYTAMGIAMLIVIILIYAFFRAKSTLVEVELTINKPVQDVYSFLSKLKNQDLYNKIRTLDTQMTKEFKGTDGEVGFIYSWASSVKEVGVGEQEIIRLVPFKRIETQIRFKKPFASNDPFTIILEPVDTTLTKVKFSYLLSMSYPTNIMLSVFSDRVYKRMQNNLLAAKSLLENQ